MLANHSYSIRCAGQVDLRLIFSVVMAMRNRRLCRTTLRAAPSLSSPSFITSHRQKVIAFVYRVYYTVRSRTLEVGPLHAKANLAASGTFFELDYSSAKSLNNATSSVVGLSHQ
jgi:hypothetical protein